MSPVRPASLKVRALQWLAQREHSRTELHDKLLRLLRRSAPDNSDGGGGQDTSDANDAADPGLQVVVVLDWLEQHGHLSDARFTEIRVRARQTRYGNRRIQQELQQHGVVLDDEARQALGRSELARASEVWRRKYGALAEDAAGRVRQMRFLAGRGFSMDVVHRVVRQGVQAVEDAAPGDDKH